MSPLSSVIVFWLLLIGLLTYEVHASQTSGFVGFISPEAPKDLSVGPAKSNLDTREPYHLLNGWLENSKKGSVSCLTSACCSEADFEQRTNLVGNYVQRTNNYKRGDPESCSTPFHELSTSFYKPTPL
jgi:hypothetical protein